MLTVKSVYHNSVKNTHKIVDKETGEIVESISGDKLSKKTAKKVWRAKGYKFQGPIAVKS